jgi:hypothetical protein
LYALYILVVVAISLLATTSYSVFTFRKSIEIESQVQKNVAQLESASILLKSQVRPIVLGGPLRAPLGRTRAGRQVLPEALSGRDRTPWGIPYAYCPVATSAIVSTETSLGPAAATVAGGDDYQVETVGSSPDGSYVVSSSLSAAVPTFQGQDDVPPADVVAFILSPLPGRDGIPFCSDIAYRDGAFVVGGSDTDGDGKQDRPPRVGGTVTAVRTDSPLLRFGIAREDPVVYVAPQAGGRGDGGTTADPMSLAQAAAWWSAAPLRNSTLSLAGGAYELSSDLDFSSTQPGRALLLRGRTAGEAGAGLPMLSSSSARYVTFAADGAMDGLSFDPQVGVRVVRGARMRITDTRLAHLRNDGGQVVLDAGTDIVHAAGHPGRAVEMTAGRIDVVAPVSVSDPTALGGIAAIVASGGVLAVSGNDMSFDIGPGGFPWLLTGTASLDVGVKTNGEVPTATWSGATHPMTGRTSVEQTCTGSAICSVSCPILTYPDTGSCGAYDEDGIAMPASPTVEENLVSAAPSGNGWRCQWSQDTIVVGTSVADFAPRPRRLPAISKARAECSATVH